MKTRMIKRKGTLLSSVAVLSTAMLLTACGGDGGDSPVDDFGSNPGEGDNQALLYAYPDNGQGEISTAAPVVLRFSSAVNLGEAGNAITLYEGDAETGTVVNTTPESVAKEPNNVLLQPDEDLKPNQTYTVVIEDLRLRKGTAKDQTLTFTTRPLHEGPKNLVVKDDDFEVSRRMPDGSAMEPVMDFSSFRFQFTQPIDRATATYGDSVTLTSSGGDTVDATLLIDGAYMTVDPDAEYLNAGETYTLDITADLASTYGETFGAKSYTFTPKDSSPGREPAILVQKLTQGNTSRLTGKPINQVPVNGTLLGEDDNITQASAEVVRAELADVTTYTDVTPIRLPKGTVLNGAEINPILIGGEVPAGFGSGDVTMTVLSDASGYLVPNPYADNNPDALRIVHLMMDVGIATSEARANGAFTQDLLHIELVGLAEVDPEAGVLNLDAVSMVEPNILGQEYGYGMLSFQLQSYKDQNNTPEAIKDTTSPTLQSWMPGNNADLQNLGDPIVLNFDEPISEKSTKGNINLYLNGEEIAFSAQVDGAALVVNPEESLKYSPETSPNVYRIVVGPNLSDVAGNRIDYSIDEQFELPRVVTEKTVDNPLPVGGTAAYQDINVLVDHSPIVLAAYPGYPCALDEDDQDLGQLWAGRCAGGFPGITDGTALDNKDRDDLVPVADMPMERSIVILFSEEIDASSVVQGQTFSVHRIDQNGNEVEAVDGALDLAPRKIVFTPNEPWIEGQYYKYTLSSSGYDIVTTQDSNELPVITASGDHSCGVDAICDLAGQPLQTQVLGITTVKDAPNPQPDREKVVFVTGPHMEAGGPALTQYFRGAKQSDSVVQILSTKPVSDTNANFFSERNNPFATSLMGQSSGDYSFDLEEYGPTSEPQSNYPSYDTNGVKPSKNSAKLLSRYDERSQEPGLVVRGANIGCSYQPLSNIPEVCPEQKFTYLTSGIVAEVTDEYVDGRGLKVVMWPSQVVGTSVPIFGLGDFGALVGVGGQTGPQYLRMRYETGPGGERREPITAWLSDSAGRLTLSAEVDLYLTAPYITTYGVGSIANGYNLSSYPVTMSLSGDVDFLDDGRMSVEQFNVAPVDIEVSLFSRETAELGGYVDLLIPEYGSRLNFVSEAIK